jgi:hypothetical protein
LVLIQKMNDHEPQNYVKEGRSGEDAGQKECSARELEKSTCEREARKAKEADYPHSDYAGCAAMKNIAIYTLNDPRDRRVRYVGKSNAPKRRLLEHINKPGTVGIGLWISELNTEGLRPILEVIEWCAISEWESRECFWIGKFRENGDALFNLHVGGNGIGTHTLAAREKLRSALLGKKKSPAHCAALRAAHIGRKLSPEHCAKLRGRKHSPETRAKIAAGNRGKKLSPEACAAISARQIGRPMTAVAIAKTAEANRGRKLSPEHIAAIVAAHIGSRHSPETRAKMRTAHAFRRLQKLTQKSL